MPAELDELALFDLATLKEHCKITADDETQDATLVRIGNAASAYCEQRTARVFKTRSIELVRDGDGRTKLLRLKYPISSVAGLTIDDREIDAADYAIGSGVPADGGGKITLKVGTFTVGVANVALSYDAGYEDESEDAEFRQVVMAALDLAKSHYDEWSVGALTLTSITVGPASAIIRPGLNPRVEKYLDSIRDVRG